MSSSMTHPDSKFEPFTLTLSNGAKLTGISHIPATTKVVPFRPLLVGIHGATCTAHHFDVDAKRTASICSAALGVPFIAFNRPNYKDTASFLPLPENSTYAKEEGKWNHEYIFPALWDAFGKPNDCTAMVTVSHSMAALGTIVATAIYAKQPSPSYPLAGIIISGFGYPARGRNRAELQRPPGSGPLPDKFQFPLEIKRDLMVSEPELGCYDLDTLQQLPAQDTYMLKEELDDLFGTWQTYWREYSDEIKVPMLYALGQYDWVWEGTKEHVEEFARSFPSSPRVDAELVGQAPHALEWWWGCQAWYARCFGWAVEVCTAVVVKQKQGKEVKQVYDRANASTPAAWIDRKPET